MELVWIVLYIQNLQKITKNAFKTSVAKFREFSKTGVAKTVILTLEHKILRLVQLTSATQGRSYS